VSIVGPETVECQPVPAGNAGRRAWSAWYRAQGIPSMQEQALGFERAKLQASGYDERTADLLARRAVGEAPVGGRPTVVRARPLTTCHIDEKSFRVAAGSYQRLTPTSAQLPSLCGLTYAKRGNFAMLDLPTSESKSAGSKQQGRACERGDIEEFSHKSRRRLQCLLNSVNRDVVPAERVFFVTLTYHNEWALDGLKWKGDLKLLYRNHLHKWGRVPAIWKMELQRRGAPHFHLLVMWPGRSVPEASAYWAWLAVVWNRVVAEGDGDHLQFGTNVQVAQSWNGVNNYAAKYLGKRTSAPVDEETGEIRSCGRWWGVWSKSELPIEFEREPLTEAQAVVCRRVLHKLSGKTGQGRMQNVRCFLLEDNAKRLVAWARSEKGECNTDVWTCHAERNGLRPPGGVEGV
jgi:hypothetical protein